MEAVKKETRGRKPLPEHARRTVRMITWLTKDEADRVEQLRGDQLRGEWLRDAAFGNAVAPIPPINQKAWADLGRTLSNLNQIARALNSGRSPAQVALENEIAEARNRLVGLSD